MGGACGVCVVWCGGGWGLTPVGHGGAWWAHSCTGPAPYHACSVSAPPLNPHARGTTSGAPPASPAPPHPALHPPPFSWQIQCAMYINSDLPGLSAMYQMPGKPMRCALGWGGRAGEVGWVLWWEGM